MALVTRCYTCGKPYFSDWRSDCDDCLWRRKWLDYWNGPVYTGREYDRMLGQECRCPTCLRRDAMDIAKELRKLADKIDGCKGPKRRLLVTWVIKEGDPIEYEYDLYSNETILEHANRMGTNTGLGFILSSSNTKCVTIRRV